MLGEKDILTKNAMCVFNIFGDFIKTHYIKREKKVLTIFVKIYMRDRTKVFFCLKNKINKNIVFKILKKEYLKHDFRIFYEKFVI